MIRQLKNDHYCCLKPARYFSCFTLLDQNILITSIKTRQTSKFTLNKRIYDNLSTLTIYWLFVCLFCLGEKMKPTCFFKFFSS